MAAIPAAQAQEPVGQDAAFEKGVELVLDELRQVGTGGLFGLSEERRGMLLHQAVQRGLLGDRWRAQWTGAPSPASSPESRQPKGWRQLSTIGHDNCPPCTNRVVTARRQPVVTTRKLPQPTRPYGGWRK